LSTWRVAGVAFVLTLALVAACAGWTSNRQHPQSVAKVRSQDKTMLSERTSPRDAKPAVPLPSEDVPGKDVSDLPRYPDSVRVEYEHKAMDALVLTRIRYLSHEKLDAVRGFYRGIFRSEGWKVANADFSDGEWTFLVVKGEREADIEISFHETGVETTMRLSAPRPLGQSEDGAASETSPPKREAAPEPASSSASASPTPASVPPASAPGDYEIEEDDWDDFGGEDD
jgi:hypothetical protein